MNGKREESVRNGSSIKREWEPSVKIVPIPRHSTEVSCSPGYGYSDRLSSLLPFFRQASEMSALILPSLLLHRDFRMVRWQFPGISPFLLLGGRSALLTFVRVALLLPFDCETVPVFTYPRFRQVFRNRSPVIIFPPSGSTFQRTPCGERRLSVSQLLRLDARLRPFR